MSDKEKGTDESVQADGSSLSEQELEEVKGGGGPEIPLGPPPIVDDWDTLADPFGV